MRMPVLDGGFALLPLLVVMTVAVGLVSAVVLGLNARVSKETQLDTNKKVNSIAVEVISRSVSAGVLPGSLQSIDGSSTGNKNNPKDAWGNALYYIYSASLSSAQTGGICGKTTTDLTVNGIPNVAFVLLNTSNGKLSSRLDGLKAQTAAPYTYAYAPDKPGNILKLNLNAPDVFKLVTIEELMSRAGCYSTTAGRLRILNNELPYAGVGSKAYSVNLYAEGGVPVYTWSKQAGPDWIAINEKTGALISSAAGIGAAGNYTLTVRVTDSNRSKASVVDKLLNLKVIN